MSRSVLQRAVVRALLPVLTFAALGAANAAHAGVSVLQPPREVAVEAPLTLTLLYSNDSTDGAAAQHVVIPRTVRVTLTNGDTPPEPLDLAREGGVPDSLELAPGQYRKVSFSAPWPSTARGMMRIDPVGFDASPVLVAVNRSPRQQTAVAATAQAASEATTPAQTAAAASAASTPSVATASAEDSLMTAGRSALSRISFYEPMYLGVGKNGDATARFQFSFKYRVLMPDDLRSKALLDNLYFAYTQTSIWDLSAASRPFRDTSYEPQLFYSIADTGWTSPWFTRMGIAAGLEHESNGQAGADSRGINIAFIRPTWEFGDLDSTHLTISPKVYYYLEKSDNEDIADYRGYVDLLIKYGSPDGWQLATTLRKGTSHWYGSIDSQLTYPLAKVLGSAWGGYIWVGYFNGYGEDILDYNNRQHWVARIGYSIAR